MVEASFGKFTEGFTTSDLIAAEGIIADLS